MTSRNAGRVGPSISGQRSLEGQTFEYANLAMPRGRESEARRFYGAVLDLAEDRRQMNPASRRGIWFRSGTLQLHLGRAPEWPARTTRVTLHVCDLGAVAARIRAAGHEVQVDSEPSGAFARAVVVDPFGHRIELMQLTRVRATRHDEFTRLGVNALDEGRRRS